MTKFTFQRAKSFNSTSPTIMKLDKRDIGVAEESIQSANDIEFLGKIIQSCSRHFLRMDLRDEVQGYGFEKEE